jgi:hypothetical protein
MNFIKNNEDLLISIFLFLNPKDLTQIGMTNKKFYHLSISNIIRSNLYKKLIKNKFIPHNIHKKEFFDNKKELYKFCLIDSKRKKSSINELSEFGYNFYFFQGNFNFNLKMKDMYSIFLVFIMMELIRMKQDLHIL